MAEPLVGAIEAGGTKFVCGVGSSPRDLSRTVLPTSDRPAEVLAAAIAWLRAEERRRGKLAALGVGSFGPIDLHRDSPSYGFVTSTPKPGWANTDVLGPLRAAFAGLPVGFDTDVNAAGLGEWRWGAARALDDFVYITVGTGIGAGGMSGGRLLHGLLHPEMGHLRIPRVPGDRFEGACPFHGDCWEGLCSGPALERRYGEPSAGLGEDHPCWPLAAEYVASGIANIVYVLSPKRVILGGGVPKAGRLGPERFLGLVRERLRSMTNGYVAAPELDRKLSEFIVSPARGDDAGLCGAIALGHAALGT
ncbi:MAG TPA: ROK family protein [Polyangiaceae bacterium]